jgi:hypothetical protein
MKSHSGMRPHDIVILLKIVTYYKKPWLMKAIAYDLSISASEVSESLNRSMIAKLVSSDKKKVMKKSLLEFLQYGLKYVYPQRPGPIGRGIYTAYSAMPISSEIQSNLPIVWSHPNGQVRGQIIEPLHPSVPNACLKDSKLYELLALSDTLRVGKAREQKLAIAMLNERIK